MEFYQLALAGITVFVAAGDQGASGGDCSEGGASMGGMFPANVRWVGE